MQFWKGEEEILVISMRDKDWGIDVKNIVKNGQSETINDLMRRNEEDVHYYENVMTRSHKK